MMSAPIIFLVSLVIGIFSAVFSGEIMKKKLTRKFVHNHPRDFGRTLANLFIGIVSVVLGIFVYITLFYLLYNGI